MTDKDNLLLSTEIWRDYIANQLHQHLNHPWLKRQREQWKAEWDAKPRSERARILWEVRAQRRREKLARAEYERISGRDFPDSDY